MAKKLTLEDCQETARTKGGKCLSKEYKNTKEKILWQCVAGHKWNARFDDVRQGKWCPFCAGTIKHTLDDCQAIAKSKNGVCLSNEYIDNETNLEWECCFGHIWKASYGNIAKRKNGTWCPVCSGNTKHSIQDCMFAAEMFGGKCLSTKYKNSDSSLTWKCSEGHVWNASYGSVRQGKWCPYCAGKHCNSIVLCNDLAKSKGGRCISESFIKTTDQIEWECSKGHRWHTSLNNIKNGGSWCPQCRLYGKTQRFIYVIICNLFPQYKVEYNFNKFDWLKTSPKGKQQLDIYVKEIGLAIEYDGRQHFEPIECWGGDHALAETKRRDRIKNKKIKKHPNDIKFFVRFNYREKITEDLIIMKLEKYGLAVENI
jgi:hypothetical protein